MNLGRYARIGCAAAFAALIAGAALADIGAFNAAVKSGNYKAAAAEAKGVWASWNPSDPDTATVAREFGFASYVAGDYAGARDYGQFLKDKGATLSKPDDQPATSRVLLAAASFRLTVNDATRKELFESLQAREAAPGLDSMSMLAAEALYKADWAAGKWIQASDTGMIAYRILGRGGDALAPRALDARSIAVAAGFLGGPDKDDYDNIIDTHDAIIDAIDATPDRKRREALVSQSFNMRAWGLAAYQFFDSSQQTGSNIPIKVKYREMRNPREGFFETTGPALAGEPCKLDLNGRAINYPSSSAYAGIVGSVIMRFDVDAEGKIIKSEMLAAVPARHFGKAVEDAIPKLRFTRAGGSPGCTLARTDYVFTLVFRIL